MSRVMITCFQVPRNPDLPKDEAITLQQEEQDKIDSAQPLTEEEIAEKESLLHQVAIEREREGEGETEVERERERNRGRE